MGEGVFCRFEPKPGLEPELLRLHGNDDWGCSHPQGSSNSESEDLKPAPITGVVVTVGHCDTSGEGEGTGHESLGLFLNKARQSQQWLGCCSQREEVLAEESALE